MKSKLLALIVFLSLIVIGNHNSYLDSSINIYKNKETIVYICNSSKTYAYHVSENYRGLNRCKASISNIYTSEAKERGYKPCKICK